MKLRIKGNSLMFRVTQAELATLYVSGRLQETIYFSCDGFSRLVYAIEHEPSSEMAKLRYESPEILIVLSTQQIKECLESKKKGIHTRIDLGERGALEILVEQDRGFLVDAAGEDLTDY